MYGYIYKTINLVNDKIYIGQKHSSKFLGEKYLGSGKLLKGAIKKYGKENFKVDLLEEIETKDLMDEREIYWISHYHATDHTIGYNISEGGNVNRTMIGENHPLYGKHHSAEAIIKNKNSNLNKCVINNGNTAIKINKTDFVQYESLGYTLGFGNTRRKSTATRPWNFGLTKSVDNRLAGFSKNHSAEAKEKISVATKGSKNPMSKENRSKEELAKRNFNTCKFLYVYEDIAYTAGALVNTLNKAYKDFSKSNLSGIVKNTSKTFPELNFKVHKILKEEALSANLKIKII